MSSTFRLSVALQDRHAAVSIQLFSQRCKKEGETYACVAANGPPVKRGTVVDPVVDDLVATAVAVAVKGAALACAHTDRRDGQVAEAALGRCALAGVLGATNAGHVPTKGHASRWSAACENAVSELIAAGRGVDIANDCSIVSVDGL